MTTCRRCQTTEKLQRCNRCYNALCATCIMVMNCPHERDGKHDPAPKPGALDGKDGIE